MMQRCPCQSGTVTAPSGWYLNAVPRPAPAAVSASCHGLLRLPSRGSRAACACGLTATEWQWQCACGLRRLRVGPPRTARAVTSRSGCPSRSGRVGAPGHEFASSCQSASDRKLPCHYHPVTAHKPPSFAHWQRGASGRWPFKLRRRAASDFFEGKLTPLASHQT